MRGIACTITLLALLALVGCGSGSGGGSSVSTGTIAGSVAADKVKGRMAVRARTTLKDTTTQPVTGATVVISGHSNLTTQTDAAGNFQITNVPTGQQTVLISASGYTTLSIQVTVQPSPAITQVTLPTATTAKYDWTVLVYLDGDNDLEAYGLMNVLQMEAIGSTSNVAILVQFARPAAGTNSSSGGYPNSLLASDAAVNGAWGGKGSDTRRYLITKNPSSNPTAMKSLLITDMGPTDMGLPTTLNNFITWGQQYAPAQHYLVDLWDHGSGWDPSGDATRVKARAICYDDTFNDQIRDTELPAALAGPNHIDIVATDACLMAMAEVAYQIDNSASYLVASEDEEPGNGLPYTDIVTELANQPTIAPRALSQYIAQDATTYWNSAACGPDTESCCSAIDLSQMPAVASAMAPFTARLQAVASANTTPLKNAFNSCQRFGPDVSYLFADLVDYASRVNTTVADSQLQTDAQNLITAVNSAVIQTNTNSGDPYAHGMSIYMPSASLYNNTSYGIITYYPNLLMNNVTNWGKWLSTQPTQ